MSLSLKADIEKAVADLQAQRDHDALISLQEDIKVGRLHRVVEAYWLWNQRADTVSCSHCQSLAGICSSKESFNDLCAEQRFCYSCGSKMVNPYASSVTLRHANDDIHAYWIPAECSETDGNANCSRCGQWDWNDAKYCRGCGARMWRVDKNG